MHQFQDINLNNPKTTANVLGIYELVAGIKPKNNR